MTVSQPVARSLFRSEDYSTKERFAIWSDSIAPLFRPNLASEIKSQAFSATTDVCMLGDALFGRTRVAGVEGYRCDGSTHAQDKSEVYMVQLYLRGGFHGYNGNRLLRVRAGDIVVLDLTQQLHTQVTDSEILSLAVPRQSLQAALGEKIPPGPCVIPAASIAGQILAKAFRHSWQLLPETNAHDAPLISGLLLGAISGLLSHSRDIRDATRNDIDLSLQLAVRSYIDRHLTSPNLTSDLLCNHFKCSRAHLYRLFAPLGGVANYIRNARLERCYRELRFKPGIPISDIALRWGFTSFSHFSRLFRATFGFTPTEIREGAPTQQDETFNNSQFSAATLYLPEYHDWLARL